MTTIAEILAKMESQHGVKAERLSAEEYAQRKIDFYNNSVGNLNEYDGYDCPLCKNRGYFAKIVDGYEVHAQCRCQITRATLRRAMRSGLGDILRDYTFAKYEAKESWQTKIKNAAQAFCKDDEANWFFIGGQVGCGKTHICTAIAAHYIKAGKETRYMLWSEESKKLKAMVNDISYQDMIEIYKTVEVLYIDDFLKVKSGESPTAADINLAFEIINHRLLENKVTIISSEKTLDDLIEYDEATMSRIFQKTGVYKFNIGKDRQKNYRLRGL